MTQAQLDKFCNVNLLLHLFSLILLDLMEFSIRPFSLPSPMSPSLGTDQAKERSVTDAMQPTSASNSSSSTIPKKRPTKSHVLAACVS